MKQFRSEALTNRCVHISPRLLGENSRVHWAETIVENKLIIVCVKHIFIPVSVTNDFLGCDTSNLIFQAKLSNKQEHNLHFKEQDLKISKRS